MENTNNKPVLRFKEFTDTWEQRELWSLTIWDKKFNEVEKEKQHRVIKYPYVLADKLNSLEDNSGKVLLLSTGSYVGFTTEEKAGSSLCEGEVVAIPWGGTPNIKYWSGKFVTADNRIATSNDVQLLRNKFLYYWMNNQIDNIDKIYRGASIKHPSMTDILGMAILYPSVNEQEKITSILTSLDSLITLHQRKYDKLINTKKALLDEMFPKAGEITPKLRFRGFTDTWEQCKFKDLAETKRGLTYKPIDVSTNGIRVLRSSNINEDYFEQKEDDVFVAQNAINIDYVKSKDILITSANGSSRLVGKHAIITNMADNTAVHGGFMLLARTAYPYFLNASMSSRWYEKFINLNVAGGNGAIGNLSKSNLDDYDILAPSDAEKLKIGELFKSIDSLITLHQRKYEMLQNIKKALLQKMFV